jgi:hypothetical protein
VKRGALIAAAMLVVTGLIGAARSQASAWWKPAQHLTWYWQLQGTPRLEPVAATDIDGFENGAAEVAKLHAAGQHVICYIDVGTWENFRPDASKFPKSVLGRGNGWPGERWLDIRRLSVLEPLMTARFQMCAHKGFDAVEPDNIDGYENATGFPITAAHSSSMTSGSRPRSTRWGWQCCRRTIPNRPRSFSPASTASLTSSAISTRSAGRSRPT